MGAVVITIVEDVVVEVVDTDPLAPDPLPAGAWQGLSHAVTAAVAGSTFR